MARCEPPSPVSGIFLPPGLDNFVWCRPHGFFPLPMGTTPLSRSSPEMTPLSRSSPEMTLRADCLSPGAELVLSVIENSGAGALSPHKYPYRQVQTQLVDEVTESKLEESIEDEELTEVKWCGCPLGHPWADCPYGHRSKKHSYHRREAFVCPNGQNCQSRGTCNGAHPIKVRPVMKTTPLATCRCDNHTFEDRQMCPYAHPVPCITHNCCQRHCKRHRQNPIICTKTNCDRSVCTHCHPVLLPQRCRYGSNCWNKSTCPLSHQPLEQMTGVCPYASNCEARRTRRGCQLAHPVYN